MHFLARGVYDLRHLYNLLSTHADLLDADEGLGHPKRIFWLTGTNAMEARLESEPLSNFKVIHFALHGLSTPNFPERSGLVLCCGPCPHKNGVLEIRDIPRLSLTATLVTLSPARRRTTVKLGVPLPLKAPKLV